MKIYNLRKEVKKMDVKKFSTIFLIGMILILTPSVFAVAPTVTRDLPSSAAPGSSFTVTLTMDVDEDDIPPTCGVTEVYPSGWTVSDISLGGVDQGSSIDWLFWSMGNVVQDQDITYQVTVPTDATGTATFSGTVDIGSIGPYDILGETEVTITGGTTTTTTSTTTTTTIPDYPAYAVRNLPSTATPGSSFQVTLSLEIDESSTPNVVGVTEIVPSGWAVTEASISPDGEYFASDNKIEWLFWAQGNAVEDQTISYTITVPSDATGTATFSGDVDYGGTTDPAIYGDTVVTISTTTTTIRRRRAREYFIVTTPTEMYPNTEVVITITDKDTNDPVEKVDVDIFLDGKKVAYGITDDDGLFKFTPIEAGEYSITLDKSRYHTSEETFTVSSGDAPTTTIVVPPTTTIVAPPTTVPPTTVPTVPTTVPPTTVPTVPTTVPPTTVPPTTVPPATIAPTTTIGTGGGGMSMLLIAVVAIIIIVVIAYFVMKGKGKGEEAEEEVEEKPAEEEEKPDEEEVE